MAQKSIITSGWEFRFGNVNMHKDLLKPGEDCLGGGFYEFDYAGSRMLLSGKSYDYGRPMWSFIGTLAMPSALSGLSITYDDIPLSDLVPVAFTL